MPICKDTSSSPAPAYTLNLKPQHSPGHLLGMQDPVASWGTGEALEGVVKGRLVPVVRNCGQDSIKTGLGDSSLSSQGSGTIPGLRKPRVGLESDGQDETQTGHRALPGLPDAESVMVGTASCCASGVMGRISLPAGSAQEKTTNS